MSDKHKFVNLNEIKKMFNEIKNNAQQTIAYNLDDEKKIISLLPNMTIEEIAKYADIITIMNADNEKFLKNQITDDLINICKDSLNKNEDILNPTSLGNLAYVALNSKKPYSTKAREAVKFLKSKL
jgi:hypothetical protein